MTDGPSVTTIKYYFYVFEKRVAHIAFHYNVLRGAGSLAVLSEAKKFPAIYLTTRSGTL
jgi:hypothetical protein